MISGPASAAPRQRAAVPPRTLVLLVSLWIASVGNLALWRDLATLAELQNPRGIAFAVAMFILIAAGSCFVLALLNWRWSLRPVLAFVLIATAIGAYFMLDYGVVLDVTMMTNVVETTTREARDLLGWRFVATLVLFGVLPALWVLRVPIARPRTGRRALVNLGLLLGSMAAIGAAVLPLFQDFSSLMRNHPQLRYEINPFNSLFSLAVIAADPHRQATGALLPIGTDAHLGPNHTAQQRPALLLLVLGETARAANFGVDGYARATTPELSKLDAAGHIASQRDAWSCGTNTAASLPCMFSHLARGPYGKRDANYENLLDVLQHAGLAVLWIDNQSGCKDVCDRIANVSTAHSSDPRYCSDGECFDEIMLQGLEERIAALPPQRVANGVVVVMHQMGSHGPAYYRRSPAAFKRFEPECTSNALQACSQQQIVNAYDNTIVYTDWFLASAIGRLKALQQRFDTALLYVSDHGESLGENNLYLHGLPYAVAPDVQRHVPWITWLAPAFEQRSRLQLRCLRARVDEPVSHDNYFHSVLGLMDVQTSVYRPGLDIYRACLAP